MKQKNLKQLITFLLLLPLCVVLLGAGCEKDDTNYDPDSIIGKWEWLYSTGGFAGTTYPEEGETVIWNFTEDSTLVITVNGEATIESDFKILQDTLNYFIDTDIQTDVEIKKYIKISGDTLLLKEYVFESFYKRIN